MLDMDDFRLEELLTMNGLFVISSIALSLAFIVVHRILFFMSPSFREISPEHKRWYVIANISKAACLFGMICSNEWKIAVYNAIIEDKFENGMILKQIAMVYIITDGVALLMVPKLPTTTKIHHYISVGLWFHLCCWEIQHCQIAKLILIYGAFSTISYMVNLFLAMRVMYDSKKWLNQICIIALATYIVSCFGNWIYHLNWYIKGIVANELPLSAFPYAVVLYYIVRDDVILMSWLWKRSFNIK